MSAHSGRGAKDLKKLSEVGLSLDALLQSEARFRSLTVLAADWVWEQDDSFRFTSWTGTGAGGLSFEPAEPVGMSLWDMPFVDVPPEQWVEHRALLEAHRPFFDLVLKRMEQSGQVRYLSLSGRPVFDTKGRLIGYRGIGKDVTDRETERQALLKSQSLLEQAMIVGRIGTWTSGLGAGASLKWSRECCRIFGISEEALEGRVEMFLRCVHPDDVEAVQHGVERAIATGAAYEIDHRIVRPDREIRWVRVRAQVVRSYGAEPIQLVGVVRDITEQRAAGNRDETALSHSPPSPE
jgi:PAS domain S-box-containing protein